MNEKIFAKSIVEKVKPKEGIAEKELAQRFDSKINQAIANAFSEFEASEKSSADFLRLFQLVFEQRNSNKEEYFFSWNIEQAEKLLGALDGYHKDEANPKSEFPLLLSIFSDCPSSGDKETLNDYFANALTKRIRAGEKISPKMEKEIQLWAQNIHIISKESRMDLTIALIRNPGVVNGAILEEIISTNAIYGRAMIRNFEKQFDEVAGDTGRMLGIIDVFESIIKRSGWGDGFESAVDEALGVLGKIKNKNKNYFIAERLELLSQFLRRGHLSGTNELMKKYADNDLTKISPEPQESRFYQKPKEFSNQFSVTKIDNKYGAIYNPRGEVDSFFATDLNQKDGLSKDSLRLEEILEKEAPEIYQSMTEKEKIFLVDNYKALLGVYFREKIEKEFGIELNQLGIREQIQFTNFLSQKSTLEMKETREVIGKMQKEKSREFCLKSFLSLEYDRQNGMRIIEIAKKLPAEKSDIVFVKISKLTDLAQEKDEELSKAIFKDGQEEVPVDMRTELLRKAHNIILKFSTELESGNKVDEQKIQKLLSDLEQSRLDIELVSALLVATKKEGSFQKLENIKGVEILNVSGEELRQNKQLESKLGEMYAMNNSHKSEKDLARLLGDFEKHKEYQPNFHLVYFDPEDKNAPSEKLENLVGFMRSSSFDGVKELEEGERYIGAMNINPLLQKFYFGENFLRETVEKELSAGAKRLIAHVPENGPSHKIVQNLGFRDIAQEGEYRDNDGKVIARRIRVELTKS